MSIKSVLRRGLLATSVVMSLFALPLTSAEASTNVIACPSSGQVYEITAHRTVEEGIGTIYTNHNVGSNNISWQISKNLSKTYGGVISGTGGANWSFVVVSIQAQLSISISLNYTSSYTVSTTMTIPPGDYGIYQQADMVSLTSGLLGNYEGGSIGQPGQLCPLANPVSVSTSIAETNYQNFESDATSATSIPPWPQAA